jgi:hypothetical protein
MQPAGRVATGEHRLPRRQHVIRDAPGADQRCREVEPMARVRADVQQQLVVAQHLALLQRPGGGEGGVVVGEAGDGVVGDVHAFEKRVRRLHGHVLAEADADSVEVDPAR